MRLHLRNRFLNLSSRQRSNEANFSLNHCSNEANQLWNSVVSLFKFIITNFLQPGSAGEVGDGFVVDHSTPAFARRCRFQNPPTPSAPSESVIWSATMSNRYW